MDFSFPPGAHEFENADRENIIMENVLSMGALENRMIMETGKVEKIPNGNAIKTIRVIRRGEDIGSIFDLRAKFWGQYLGVDADRD